jgi:hypothetical protein
MSQKQSKFLKFQAALDRDRELCQRPGCFHKRAFHIGDMGCVGQTINACTCEQFVPKTEAAK